VDKATRAAGEGTEALFQDEWSHEGVYYECKRKGSHVVCGEEEIRAEKVDQGVTIYRGLRKEDFARWVGIQRVFT